MSKGQAPPNKLIVVPGEKYGMLTILSEKPAIAQYPSGQTQRAFLCKCDCGNTHIVKLRDLRNNKVRSCGCLVPLHGMCYTYLYSIWAAMLTRVNSPYHPNSDRYHFRGITVCEAWRKFIPFKNWAFENGFKEGLQIDRIDNDGNYEPSNCRFVTATENVNNRSITCFVEYQGRRVAFTDLLREHGFTLDNYAAIKSRLSRGWSVELAFNTPIRQGNYKRRLS